ncbi:MAG: hypothetical protein AAF414_12745 [Pseudomonadota bacterium]
MLVLIGSICALAIFICVPTLRTGLIASVAGDSLFNLTPRQATGVALFSAIFAVIGGMVSVQKSLLLAGFRSHGALGGSIVTVADLAITATGYAVVYSLVPQLYYAFYRMIIPGLPDQWVVRSWFDVHRVERAILVLHEGRLADLVAGLLFWTLLAMTLWIHAAFWGRNRAS